MVGRLGPGSCGNKYGWYACLGCAKSCSWNSDISSNNSLKKTWSKQTRECINALNNGFLLAIIYSVPVSLIGFLWF